jgi:ferredoxin
MPKITFTSATGESRVVEATAGDSAMQTAVRNGVPGIVGECGGVLSCATCHVFVDEADLDRLPPMSEIEDEMRGGPPCQLPAVLPDPAERRPRRPEGHHPGVPGVNR